MPIINQRFAIELSYHGGGFHGWQIQPNAHTVQEAINQGLSTLLNAPVSVVGAGRTDAGVHASHFVAHFDWAEDLADPDRLTYRLNSFLKDGIRIHRIIGVDSNFHSRFSAIRRTYHYLICLDKNPFMKEFSWMARTVPEIEKMQEAASHLMGTHDFTSFARLHTSTKTNICRIDEAVWKTDANFLVFRISADRFLRNMVRSIVGTLWDIGTGAYPPEGVLDIMHQKDRSAAGQSAPAQGLFLSAVEYPTNLFQSKPEQVFPILF